MWEGEKMGLHTWGGENCVFVCKIERWREKVCLFDVENTYILSENAGFVCKQSWNLWFCDLQVWKFTYICSKKIKNVCTGVEKQESVTTQ